MTYVQDVGLLAPCFSVQGGAPFGIRKREKVYATPRKRGEATDENVCVLPIERQPICKTIGNVDTSVEVSRPKVLGGDI